MTSILRTTALLGSSSVLTVLISMVAAKFTAELLGPSGLGFMGLLLSLLGLASLISGLGVSAGIVRMGANALNREDVAQVAALRGAARWLLLSLGGLAMVLLVLFREPIGRWSLDSGDEGGSVALIGIAVFLSLSASLLGSTLNAYHRVGALAKIGILHSVFGNAVSILLIWVWGERGILPAIIAGGAVAWLITFYFVRREVPAPAVRAKARDVRDAVGALLRFGVPYTGSMVVGGGVQLLLPILILHTLDQESVGYFRAAQGIAVGYIGFLLGAMAQDYYPRVSAVSHEPRSLIEVANLQHRMLMMLGVPVIFGMLAIAPYVVPLIYTSEFAPTVVVLEWQLIGDLLRFSSWTLSFVILARSRSSVFFLTELASGVVTLLVSWFAVRWFGLAGLGAAFPISYAVYFGIVWFVVRREIGFSWSRENKLVLAAALAVALIGRAFSALGPEELRTPFALTLAVGAGLISLRALWSEVGPEVLRRLPAPWRRRYEEGVG